MKKRNPWIETHSGVEIDLLDPKIENFKIDDIAIALSRQCRYNGACREFYSVAQHSVLVAELIEVAGYSPAVVFAGLMHDAHEAYLGDVVQPIKMLPGFGELFQEIEDRFDAVIAERFGIKWTAHHRAIVSSADRSMCLAEARDLMVSKGNGWQLSVRASDTKVRPWGEDQARREFLTLFRTLEDQCS